MFRGVMSKRISLEWSVGFRDGVSVQECEFPFVVFEGGGGGVGVLPLADS